MLSYEVYKAVHIFGIALLLMAFGGVALHNLNGGNKESNKQRKRVAATHGIALVLILLGGFGMLARLGTPNAFAVGWVHPKLLIWVLMGAALVLLNRKPQLSGLLWWVLPILTLTAGLIAIYKPFT